MMATDWSEKDVQVVKQTLFFLQSFVDNVAENYAFGKPPANSLTRAEMVRLAERELSLGKMRGKLLGSAPYASSHWTLLLDMFVSQVRSRPVSVTSACLATGAPPTTGLRRIEELEERGFIKRAADPTDKRRVFLILTDSGNDILTEYLTHLGSLAPLGTP